MVPSQNRPERLDGPFVGVDDDADGEVDEVQGVCMNYVSPPPAGYDADGDGYTDPVEGGANTQFAPLCWGNTVNDDNFEDGYTNDGCPARNSPETNCSNTLDDDSDGIVNDGCPKVGTYSEAQFSIGTGHQDACGNNGWPSDLAGGDNRVSLQDVTSFTTPAPTKLNTSPGQTGFDSRWDLVPGPGSGSYWITMQDLTTLTAGTAGSPAYPPMPGGAKAFGGPPCPWPP